MLKINRKILLLIIKYLIVFLLAFVSIYFIATGVGLFISHKKEYVGEKKYKIYMATGRIHTDFILPYNSDLIRWSDFINLADFKKLRFMPKYIQLGWGERGFYLEMMELENLTLPIAFRAAFMPSQSLMHVTYHGELPFRWYELKEVKLTKKQYETLISYLRRGFQLKDGKPIIVPNKGYYQEKLIIDNFYEGVGSYHLFNTCNMWTARGMYEAGIETSVFTPLKYGVSKFID